MSDIITIDGVSCYEQEGTAYLKLDTVARGLGFTQEKNGVVYVRWETVFNYLQELQFSQQVGKDGYIPENVFYRLAMKAKNEVAERFQAKVADEIIPSIRKHGQYVPNQDSRKELQIEAAKLLVKIAERYMGTSYEQVLHANATKELTGEFLLPLPKLEAQTYSAGEIGAKLGISGKKVGSLVKQNNLKTDQYGEWFKDKSRYSDKEVSTFRYYENIIPVLEALLTAESA